jgi:hypothetical protein
MRVSRHTVSLVATSILVLLSRSANAQSLVAGVPNTDVTQKGVVMVAHESQFSSKDNKPYWNSFTFGTYGIGNNVELAATLYGIGLPYSGNVTIAVGYKHRIPLTKRSPWEPTFVWGNMLPLSLTGDGVGFWSYGGASIRLPELRTRLTAGPSYGSRQIFGVTSLSMFAAIEQPITKHFALIADWFSGSTDLGALITAVQINPIKAFTIIAGVKIPNSERAGPFAGMIELTYEIGHEDKHDEKKEE